MRLGRAAHCAILEPESFAARWGIWEGRRAGGAWEAYLSRLPPDAETLSASEHEQVQAMRAAAFASPAARYLAGGRAEIQIYWHYRDRACKGRLDYIHPSLGIIDIKTTRDASPRAFAAESWRRLYHGQAAWYADGHLAHCAERTSYTIIAIENIPPYIVSIYRIPNLLLDLGRDLYSDLLSRLIECEETGSWPGYLADEADLEIPAWAQPREGDDDGF